MHLTKSIYAMLLVLLCASCVSTQEVTSRLGSELIGTNFDNFVLAYGPPQRKHILNNGDIVYVWHSGVSSVNTPMTATTTTTGKVATTQVSGGGSIKLLCEAQFVTSTDGTIKDVRILKDTIGYWTTSRCHEVFKRK